MKKIFGNFYTKNENHINKCAKKHKVIISNNMEMKDLLQISPFFVLESYLPLIDYVVHKYAFDNDDFDDLRQEIYLYFIDKKLNYIVSNFDSQLEFTPYILKIIVNTCFEIQRKKASLNEVEYDENYVEEDFEENTDSIEKEKFFIEKILANHFNSKIILAFKVFNKIPILKNEIQNTYKTMSPWDLKKASQILLEPSNSNIPFYVELSNKYERVNRKPDSIRRLIHRYLHELLNYINGTTRNYDIKSITQMLILIYNDHFNEPLEQEVV